MIENSETIDLHTKEMVESISIGDISITFHDVSEYWNDKSKVSDFADKFSTVIRTVNSRNIIGIEIHLLSLIIITSDLEKHAIYWAKQLNRREGITKHKLGFVAGKIIFWNHGDFEESSAIMLIHESIAYAFVSSEIEIYRDAENIIVHELAHITTESLKLLRNDRLQAKDFWTKNKYGVARVLWDEFFANYKAYQYAKNSTFVASNNIVMHP